MADLLALIRAHNWYAVLAIALQVLVIQGFRKHPVLSTYWEKIPSGLRFLPGAVLSFATGFVAAYSQGLPLMGATITGALAIVGLGLPAAGLAAWLKESPLPWDGGAGGTASPGEDEERPTTPTASTGVMKFVGVVIRQAMLVTLLGTAVLAPAVLLSGCPGPSATAADRYERLAYNTAVVLLEQVDGLEAERVQAIRTRPSPPPTADELEAAENAVARLERVRVALGDVKDILDAKKTGKVDESLKAALDALGQALEEAKSDGLPVTSTMTETVDSAIRMLGSP